MNRLKYTLLGVLGLLFMMFCSCERSGLDDDKFYVKKEFRPVANFAAETGFGKATFKWDLPDSTSTLQYMELCWNDTNDFPVRRILTKYQDTIRIDSLLAFDYTFRMVSHGEKGEISTTEPIVVSVKDWQLEPPVSISDLKMMIAENSLILDWVNPSQRVFAGVVFEIYKGGELVASHETGRAEAPSYVFMGLEYRTDDYELRYYSVSGKEIHSEVKALAFVTGDVAPVVPEIRLYTKRLDAAHCAELEWDDTEGLDTLLIRFKDLNGAMREYRYKGNTNGYASLLPGGTTELEVQTKGTNGTWSFPVKQKIKTKLSDDTYVFRAGNGPTGFGASKIAERLIALLGKGGSVTATTAFSFRELAGMEDFDFTLQLRWVDELELMVNVKLLKFKFASSNSGVTASDKFTPADFVKLLDRLPLVEEVHLDGNLANFRAFKEVISAHPKIKVFKQI